MFKWLEARKRKEEGRAKGAEHSREVRSLAAQATDIEHQRKLIEKKRVYETNKQLLELERRKYMEELGFEETEESTNDANSDTTVDKVIDTIKSLAPDVISFFRDGKEKKERQVQLTETDKGFEYMKNKQDSLSNAEMFITELNQMPKDKAKRIIEMVKQ